MSDRHEVASPRHIHDGGLVDTRKSKYALMHGTDLGAVRLTEGFWAEKFKTCVNVSVPKLYNRMADPKQGHVIENMRIAAGLAEGEFVGPHWKDAWLFKWVEMAAATYEVTRDIDLLKAMNALSVLAGQAQQDDGYLATQITVTGKERFTNNHHHELYTMGHLMTAACIHTRVTGDETLLNVACKAADYVLDVYKYTPDRVAHYPFNPSIIMGAVELYRTTGKRDYLELAQRVVDHKGRYPGGSDQNQDRFPLREETDIVGHSVLSTYLYAGAADLYMETGDTALLMALDRIWRDFTSHKMYITGGACALHRGHSLRPGKFSQYAADDVHEAVGLPYELHNADSYNETCAQVGVFMWSWRMLLITGQARFADLMEREMYNGWLPAVALDGESWFYTNPLRWYGEHQTLQNEDSQGRFLPGTSHICCPTNVTRTIAELRGYVYSTSGDALYVHHYAGSVYDGETWGLRQETHYPWDGKITMSFDQVPGKEADLYLRIPAWAEGATVQVNDEAALAVDAGRYAKIKRMWMVGDRVVLLLPMAITMYEAHPQVEADRNHVAVMRGPVLYCLESVDLDADVKLAQVRIPRDVAWTTHFDPARVGGVMVVEGEGYAIPDDDWGDTLYRKVAGAEPVAVKVTLIPYYTWANRGMSEMAVWLPLG